MKLESINLYISIYARQGKKGESIAGFRVATCFVEFSYTRTETGESAAEFGRRFLSSDLRGRLLFFFYL